MKEFILTLPEIVEVYVEIFDIAVGGILMQDGHPIAYKSHKISDVEK